MKLIRKNYSIFEIKYLWTNIQTLYTSIGLQASSNFERRKLINLNSHYLSNEMKLKEHKITSNFSQHLMPFSLICIPVDFQPLARFLNELYRKYFFELLLKNGLSIDENSYSRGHSHNVSNLASHIQLRSVSPFPALKYTLTTETALWLLQIISP